MSVKRYMGLLLILVFILPAVVNADLSFEKKSNSSSERTIGEQKVKVVEVEKIVEKIVYVDKRKEPRPLPEYSGQGGLIGYFFEMGERAGTRLANTMNRIFNN